DLPGLAPVTDPNLVNPWGVASSPTGPFWFADNGTGVSDLLDGRGRPFALAAAVPGAGGARGEPTGTTFNGGPGLVVSDGTGSAPFSVRPVGDRLYVTYARRDAGGGDDLPGPASGVVDEYATDGRFVRRFATGGPLDAPWGLALAPAGFGPFGGALLVGNVGD